MRHIEIADRIRSLVAAEDFDQAAALLPEYARAVTEECVTAQDEVAFISARDFVRRTVGEVRARRAHMQVKLTDMQRQRPFLATRTPQHELDVSG
jgi:hypothetical protein